MITRDFDLIYTVHPKTKALSLKRSLTPDRPTNIFDLPTNIMVVDEIHMARNPGKLFVALSTLTENANLLAGLTATPIITKVEDVVRGGMICRVRGLEGTEGENVFKEVEKEMGRQRQAIASARRAEQIARLEGKLKSRVVLSKDDGLTATKDAVKGAKPVIAKIQSIFKNAMVRWMQTSTREGGIPLIDIPGHRIEERFVELFTLECMLHDIEERNTARLLMEYSGTDLKDTKASGTHSVPANTLLTHSFLSIETAGVLHPQSTSTPFIEICDRHYTRLSGRWYRADPSISYAGNAGGRPISVCKINRNVKHRQRYRCDQQGWPREGLRFRDSQGCGVPLLQRYDADGHPGSLRLNDVPASANFVRTHSTSSSASMTFSKSMGPRRPINVTRSFVRSTDTSSIQAVADSRHSLSSSHRSHPPASTLQDALGLSSL